MGHGWSRIRSELWPGTFSYILLCPHLPFCPLAIVSNLGHTGDVKSIIFHPQALEFIRGEDPEMRKEIGEALRDLQKGISLGLPLSRPMPEVASGSHELRIRGKATAVRVFYLCQTD